MIQKSIKIKEKNIDYTLIVSKRSKSVRLSVRQDGTCLVSTPRYIPQFIINNFLRDKSDWIINKMEHFLQFKGSAFKKGTKVDYLKYKKEALLIVNNRIKYFNTFYGYKWNRIVIRNQSTRWGSCSKKGNLNFNYKIALLPEKAADYIIVHELCHLREFNHSHNFWNLVALTIPDYKEIRKQLKNNGFTLS